MSDALTINSANPRYRKAPAFNGFLLGNPGTVEAGIVGVTDVLPMSADTGAPSHNAAVVNELYVRINATTWGTLLYRATDTSGTWEALTVTALDAGLASLATADAAAGLAYVSAANTWSMLTLAANKGVYATAAGAMATYDLTAYGRSIGGVADEAAFKALVNLEIGTDVQAFSANLSALAAGTAAVIGPVSSPMTADQVLANGNTITLPTTGKSKSISSASAVTGIILTAGTVGGQEVLLLNSNPSGGDSITFDATPATSKVAQGTHAIAAATAKLYSWNATAGLWFPVG